MKSYYMDFDSIMITLEKFPDKIFAANEFTSAWTIALIFMNINNNNYDYNRATYIKIKNSNICIDWDLPDNKAAKAYGIEFKGRNELLKESFNEILETGEYDNLSEKTKDELNIFSRALNNIIENSKNEGCKKVSFGGIRLAMSISMIKKAGPENTIKVMSSYDHSLDRYIHAQNYFYNDNDKNDIVDKNEIGHFFYLNDNTIFVTNDNYLIKLDKKYKKTINISKYFEEIDI